MIITLITQVTLQIESNLFNMKTNESVLNNINYTSHIFLDSSLKSDYMTGIIASKIHIFITALMLLLKIFLFLYIFHMIEYVFTKKDNIFSTIDSSMKKRSKK